MGNTASQQNVPDSLRTSPYFRFLSKLFQDVTSQDKSRIVTVSKFKELFSDENGSIIELLYKYLTTNGSAHNVDCHNMQKVPFISGFDRLLKLEYESQDMVTFYTEMFTNGKMELTVLDITAIFHSIISFELNEDIGSLKQPSRYCEEIAKSLFSRGADHVDRTKCAKQVFQLWPRLFNPLHSWILKSLSKREDSNATILLPKHKCQKIQLSTSSDSQEILDPISLWLLSVSLPTVYLKHPQDSSEILDECTVSEWRKIYDSSDHGLSHNRFKHHCFSYRGPTVMTILLENNIKLVLAIDVEWRESTKTFGNTGTRLYQVYPQFKVVCENSMVLFNEKSRGTPVGLILGNNPGRPALSLLDGLTSAMLGYLGGQEVNVQIIQVWGCAGIKAEVDQKQQQNWEKRQAEQLQKVKLPGAWDDNPDKAILDMAGITTEHARR